MIPLHHVPYSIDNTLHVFNASFRCAQTRIIMRAPSQCTATASRGRARPFARTCTTIAAAPPGHSPRSCDDTGNTPRSTSHAIAKCNYPAATQPITHFHYRGMSEQCMQIVHHLRACNALLCAPTEMTWITCAIQLSWQNMRSGC